MKKFRIITLVCLLLATCLTFAACVKPEPKTWNVTFDNNYEDAPSSAVVVVEEGQRVTAPEAPQREGYAFDGWYSDSECQREADFGRVVTKDVTYYAAWEKTSFVVTFDVNYENGDSFTQTVNKNDTAVFPEEPTREGYLFDNWFSDQDCQTLFDFTSEISQDTTVYAKWQEDSGNNVVLTYYFNYESSPNEGVYRAYTQEKGLRLPTGIVPTRQGYLFKGWFTDVECTQKASSTVRINENTNLYAYWYKEYTFEIEYVKISELEGFGYSGNASGLQMIEKDNGEMQASNGYYLGWLYNPGLEMVYYVDAATDATEVVIALRLSAEYGDSNKTKTLTDDTFRVEVNGQKISYTSITFVNVPDGSDEYKLAFATYTLNRNVTLAEGTNVIKLIINNNIKGEGGTMNATAPMIDCMYLYSDVELTWAEGYPLTDNLIGK